MYKKCHASKTKIVKGWKNQTFTLPLNITSVACG